MLKTKIIGPTGMKGLAAIKNIVEKWSAALNTMRFGVRERICFAAALTLLCFSFPGKRVLHLYHDARGCQLLPLLCSRSLCPPCELQVIAAALYSLLLLSTYKHVKSGQIRLAVLIRIDSCPSLLSSASACLLICCRSWVDVVQASPGQTGLETVDCLRISYDLIPISILLCKQQ